MSIDVQELRKRIISLDHLIVELGDGPEKVFANFKIIPLDLIIPAEWNYKTNDEEKARKLENNIRRNGQVENVLVRDLPTGYFEMVNGNHRQPAFRNVGMRFAFCYDCGPISLAEAQRLAIETNETRFDSDALKLGDLLGQLAQVYSIEELTATLPYSPESLSSMISLTDFDWRPPTLEQANGGPAKRKVLKLTLSAEAYGRWEEWLNRCTVEIGQTDQAESFDLAITRALELPAEALRP
jgi:hypothetical protein